MMKCTSEKNSIMACQSSDNEIVCLYFVIHRANNVLRNKSQRFFCYLGLATRHYNIEESDMILNVVIVAFLLLCVFMMSQD
jgi:hypothetical protein